MAHSFFCCLFGPNPCEQFEQEGGDSCGHQGTDGNSPQHDDPDDGPDHQAPDNAPVPSTRPHDNLPMTRSTNIRSTPTMVTSWTWNSLSAR